MKAELCLYLVLVGSVLFPQEAVGEGYIFNFGPQNSGRWPRQRGGRW